jgi:GTP-binding protein EngB required for normal cell division
VKVVDANLSGVLDFVKRLAVRYHATSLAPLIDSCARLARADALNVAVFGRFKAGKSSFLNHFLERPLLPVGVTPVTSVVTEIGYGPEDRATVQYLDGHQETIPLERIAEFISEKENPENAKAVSLVHVELHTLAEYRGLRFVDTPGLESVLAHNTEASLNWLPDVALALVTISVDTPLSKQDISLLDEAYRHTPEVAILITKVDLLREPELVEIEDFVRKEIGRALQKAPPVYRYSIRPGYERLRTDLVQKLLYPRLLRLSEEKASILRHKTGALLRECESYLTLALASAAKLDSERAALKTAIIGEKAALEQRKAELRLIANHAVAGTFETIMKEMERFQPEIERSVLEAFEVDRPGWGRMNLRKLTEAYEAWLQATLSDRLHVLSTENRDVFTRPLVNARSQLVRSLQSFRDHLAQRAFDVLGVELRLSEVDVPIAAPRGPQINVGQTFEHHIELLWFVVPMALFRGMVERRFQRKLPYEVYKNLSRLSAQWSERVNEAILSMEKEVERQMDVLVSTLDHLLSQTGLELPRIEEDLHRVKESFSV